MADFSLSLRVEIIYYSHKTKKIQALFSDLFWFHLLSSSWKHDWEPVNPSLWAVVDTDRTAKKFKISSVIPGWEIGNINPDKYIGTIQIGGFVWHYFWEWIRTPMRLKEKI